MSEQSPPAEQSSQPSVEKSVDRSVAQSVEQPHTGHGFGRVLVAVYGLLALAATGRSILQMTEYFDRAPVSYVLSALAAGIYIVATVGLARGDRTSVRLATVALTVELVGVLVVGAISSAVPSAFPDKTVWSHFGSGYGYVPLLLPLVGLWWIRRTTRAERAVVAPGGLAAESES
jgi:hypothetical protein